MAARTAAARAAGRRHARSRLRPLDGVVAVLLATGAAALRAGPLGPSSLWLDDAWTALVVRADSVAEAAALAVTAPGFGLLLRAWLQAVGFSETAAQLPPFAFAVLGPPAVYLVGVTVGLRRTAAGVAGLLLLAAPAHLTNATRVKQYTLDALLATGVIALAWRVLAAPREAARWATLAAIGTLATLVSAQIAPVVVAALAAGLLAARRAGAALGAGLGATTAYGVLGGAWYLAYLRPSVSPALRAYWSGHYLDLADGPRAVAAGLVQGLGGVLGALSAVPAPFVAVPLLAAAGWALLRRPAVAVLLAGPLAVTVLLAALRLAPLGGGRTDIVLLPGLALLAAVGVDAAAGADRRAAAGLAAAVLAATALARPDAGSYPSHDVRPLVARMEAALRPGDAVLVYSATRWAYGLYTGFDVAFPPDPRRGTGFDVAVADPRVRILEPQRHTAERYAADVSAGIRGAQRVWLLASGWRGDLAVLERLIGDRGLVETSRESRPGGLLVRWERP
ncbi:MAG TPA: hypothetical protein VM324_01470 [Egibacteraceae bacterium]|nr:hypothetical protein [Egibacteraceae bacterium]